MNKISLCIICKNEEATIAGCLESAVACVDEIVVVDTGSTDGTREIAAQFRARVVEAPWVDFSTARNRSLAAATGGWVLVLDADERLRAEALETLHTLADSGRADAFLVRIVNKADSGAGADRRVSHNYVRRFFKREGARFVNPIHETLELPEGATVAVAAGLEIDHFGYFDETVDKRGKADRNSALIEAWLASEPDNPLAHFYMAHESFRAGDAGRAALEYETALPGLLATSAVSCASDAFIYLSMCYEELGQVDMVVPLLERGIGVFPDCVDLQYIYGCFLLRSGNAQEAADRFYACLQTPEGLPQYGVSMEGAGSWRALEQAGNAFESMGQLEKAYVARYSAFALSGGRSEAPDDALQRRLGPRAQELVMRAAEYPRQSLRAVSAFLFGGGMSQDAGKMIGRNEPCPCGSGKKYKKCHGV